MQQESRPDAIQELDRAIVTIQIELESLRKETDVLSKERREKLQQSLKEKQELLKELMLDWQKEKSQLEALKTAKEDLERARVELEQARRLGNFERAGQLQYETIPKLEAQIPKEGETRDPGSTSLLHDSVDAEDIARVVSRATGIPTQKLVSGEVEKLVHMEDKLRAFVKGQDDALAAVADAVRLQRAGLTNEHRPLASFMFLGPTGVGKTELCKRLAEFLFSSENAVIRFDMSEFQEKHTISRLIGSPAGYVGYEDAGQLTEAVRRRPYAVLLFDEFEKAHRDISNLLLQILDEGYLTDAQGRRVDFRSTIIVLTSNLGADVIVKDKSENELSPETRQKVMDIVQASYAPEFLNRIDEFILFKRLSRDAIRDIVDICLKELQERLNDRRIVLSVDDAVKDYLSDKGYSPEWGARPLQRLVMKELLNPMAMRLIRGEIRSGETAKVKIEGEGDGRHIVVVGNHEPDEVQEKK